MEAGLNAPEKSNLELSRQMEATAGAFHLPLVFLDSGHSK
jgi:hypothetical protein